MTELEREMIILGHEINQENIYLHNNTRTVDPDQHLAKIYDWKRAKEWLQGCGVKLEIVS